MSQEQASRFLDALRLVQIGGGDAGWGGESSKIWPIGAVEAWEAEGIAKRGPSVGMQGAKSAAWGSMVLYVGLESPDDVMGDLASALGAL